MDETEITEKEIYSPHVFIQHLCMRIFAFVLQENGDSKNNNQYITFLRVFTEKLCSQGSFLKNSSTKIFDAVGIYLGSDHGYWINTLEQMLSGQALLKLHEDAFKNAENLLALQRFHVYFQ